MSTIKINRKPPNRALISLVPLVDVMLILLVFFMVTSTYLDLDIIPVFERPDPLTDDKRTEISEAVPLPMLIRLDGFGLPSLGGQTLTLGDLGTRLQARLETEPLTAIVVFPSATAKMQSLISIMETATNAGAKSLQVMRLEARK